MSLAIFVEADDTTAHGPELGNWHGQSPADDHAVLLRHMRNAVVHGLIERSNAVGYSGLRMSNRLAQMLPRYFDDSQAGRGSLLGPSEERLAQIARLDDDWDTYGGLPPSGTAVRRTHQLFRDIERSFGPVLGEKIRPFSVSPLPNGGVQAEWRSTEGALEVEINADGSLGFLLVDGSGPGASFEEGDVVQSRQILELLSRVLLPN